MTQEQTKCCDQTQ